MYADPCTMIYGLCSEWALDFHNGFGGVSYRTVTALKLYSALELKEAVDLWRDTIMGVREVISLENEARWRMTLKSICLNVIERARQKLADGTLRLDEIPLRTLWEEEIIVAEAVLRDVVECEKGFV
jgi:hypothetical protein